MGDNVILFVTRYLDRYEKVHFLGEVGERANDDDEDNRHRRWSARALHSVPLTYNYSQHNVNGKLCLEMFCCRVDVTMLLNSLLAL